MIVRCAPLERELRANVESHSAQAKREEKQRQENSSLPPQNAKTAGLFAEAAMKPLLRVLGVVRRALFVKSPTSNPNAG